MQDDEINRERSEIRIRHERYIYTELAEVKQRRAAAEAVITSPAQLSELVERGNPFVTSYAKYSWVQLTDELQVLNAREIMFLEALAGVAEAGRTQAEARHKQAKARRIQAQNRLLELRERVLRRQQAASSSPGNESGVLVVLLWL
jgi:hypothetical protein